MHNKVSDWNIVKTGVRDDSRCVEAVSVGKDLSHFGQRLPLSLVESNKNYLDLFPLLVGVNLS